MLPICLSLHSPCSTFSQALLTTELLPNTHRHTLTCIPRPLRASLWFHCPQVLCSKSRYILSREIFLESCSVHNAMLTLIILCSKIIPNPEQGSRTDLYVLLYQSPRCPLLGSFAVGQLASSLLPKQAKPLLPLCLCLSLLSSLWCALLCCLLLWALCCPWMFPLPSRCHLKRSQHTVVPCSSETPEITYYLWLWVTSPTSSASIMFSAKWGKNSPAPYDSKR